MPSEISTPHTAKLNAREQVAEGTMAFYFDKPTGFEFRAGQALDITLLNPRETDSEGDIRTFSIASPPFEDRLRWLQPECEIAPLSERSSVSRWGRQLRSTAPVVL